MHKLSNWVKQESNTTYKSNVHYFGRVYYPQNTKNLIDFLTYPNLAQIANRNMPHKLA